MTTDRNKYWLLDSVAGWRISQPIEALTFDGPNGAITLDPLPGNAMLLDPNLASGIQSAVAISGDTHGRLFVLDGGANRVTVVELSEGRTRTIEAFGGAGRQPRQFRKPASLAVLPSGAIAVADTGNGRVQLFSARPHVLLHVWQGRERPLKPVAVAGDRCGVVHIADTNSKSILRVRAHGDWLDPLGVGMLRNPVAVAVSGDGTVAVVDGSGSTASIVIFPPDGEGVRVNLVEAPLSVSFDAAGNLFVGTANALISKLERDANKIEGWSLGGDGVSDMDGAVSGVAWVAGHGIFAILTDPATQAAPRLFSMNPSGAFRLEGTFTTDALDSNIERCSWHRVQSLGPVPPGTSLEIKSSTSESPDDGYGPFVECTLTTGQDPDCLVQSAAGRYLKLQFTLRSNGSVSPEIRAIKVFFPRESYLQYLPAVFQEDDESRLFLERFLSIFQTSFDGFDSFIDTLWQLFDPLMTPDKYFPWLAGWLALPLDPGMNLAQRRSLLKGIFENYRIRGTVHGLEQAIQDYTTVTNVRILEHFRLRNWTHLQLEGGLCRGSRLWSHAIYGRLQVGVTSEVGAMRLTNSPQPAEEPYDWGSNRFSVLFPANPYTFADTEVQVRKVLDREKPAYTEAVLCPIFPRSRVGVQATVGIDAYLGKTSAMILGKMATLSYDAVLARSQWARDTLSLGASPEPRVGVDSTIL